MSVSKLDNIRPFCSHIIWPLCTFKISSRINLQVDCMFGRGLSDISIDVTYHVPKVLLALNTPFALVYAEELWISFHYGPCKGSIKPEPP